MLKNISNGHLVKREYIEHILNAKSIGQAPVEEFIEVRLNERSVSFWNKVKKMNLYHGFITGSVVIFTAAHSWCHASVGS